MFLTTPKQVFQINGVQRVELPPAVATSAVRDACSSASSMKCFKRSNVKPSPTATPSFAKAKLLKVFLTDVRMLEECLAASLGDLRGVRAGEKLDDKEVRLVGDAISLGKCVWVRSGTCLKIVYPLAKVGWKKISLTRGRFTLLLLSYRSHIMDSCYYRLRVLILANSHSY